MQVGRTENETNASTSKGDSWNLARFQVWIVFAQKSLGAELSDESPRCAGLANVAASVVCVWGDPCHPKAPPREPCRCPKVSSTSQTKTRWQLGTLFCSTDPSFHCSCTSIWQTRDGWNLIWPTCCCSKEKEEFPCGVFEGLNSLP